MIPALAQKTDDRAIEPDDVRLARPLFTLREAAGYLGIPNSTIHGWARSAGGKPPLITALPRRGAHATVSFIGFTEAYVLSAFRRAGVSLQRIRPAVDRLSQTIGIDHALASQRLYTNGAEVLYDYASESDETDLLELVVVRTGQHQFSEVVRDYLKRVTYGSDGWACRVHLASYRTAEVVVDPRTAFGLPFVVHGGARVEDLVDRFLAGDSIAEVAEDFRVPPEEVEDLIRVAARASA